MKISPPVKPQDVRNNTFKVIGRKMEHSHALDILNVANSANSYPINFEFYYDTIHKVDGTLIVNQIENKLSFDYYNHAHVHEDKLDSSRSGWMDLLSPMIARTHGREGTYHEVGLNPSK